MKTPDVHVDYDKEADVLYISFGKPVACTCDDSTGVVVRHAAIGGRLNGITIVNYKHKTTPGFHLRRKKGK